MTLDADFLKLVCAGVQAGEPDAVLASSSEHLLAPITEVLRWTTTENRLLDHLLTSQDIQTPEVKLIGALAVIV